MTLKEARRQCAKNSKRINTMEILTLIAVSTSSAMQIHILIRLIDPEVGSLLPRSWCMPSIDRDSGLFLHGRMHQCLGFSVCADSAAHTSPRVGFPSIPPTVVPLTPPNLHHHTSLRRGDKADTCRLSNLIRWRDKYHRRLTHLVGLGGDYGVG
jgi:hypothetical protein